MAEPVSDLKAEAQDYLNKHQVISVLESAVNDLMKDKPSEPFGYLADKLTELVPVAKPEVVFVLGGPGSGKGTQCANIVREYGFVHLSAGDLLRDERKSGGETGTLIDKYIVEGKIVPVEITVGLLKKAMEKQILRGNSKFLIDGFPRNQDNLQGWERVMGGFATVRFVLFFDCPEEVMEKRLLKRGETSGRTDDNIESIKKRFRVFITETTPVIAAYEKKGLVKKVNSDRTPDECFALIRNVFDNFFKTGELQTTFVLIKPDAFATHREAILLKIHQANFAVLAKQRVHIKRHLAAKLFGDDEKQISHLTSGPSLALALRLESGIKRFITLAGPTDPEQAKKSHGKSLRALFGTDSIRNAVYCSADLDHANRDLEAFFPSNLFLNYIPKRIIIAGAPASGKGTQCEFITEKYGVVHLSTGDLLREAAKNGTELGLKAKGYMEKGQLVPDDLVIGLVKDKLESKEVQLRGWLLDGFPRTKVQAEALVKAVGVPHTFIFIDAPDEILVERVTGRRTDPDTHKVYHLKFNPPPEEIKTKLVQRPDDTSEKVKVRLTQFHEHITAVLSYFGDTTTVVKVNGNQDKGTIFKQIEQQLG